MQKKLYILRAKIYFRRLKRNISKKVFQCIIYNDFKLFDPFATKVFMKFISKLFHDSETEYHEAKKITLPISFLREKVH